MINCSFTPKPQAMCAAPCLHPLHRCLSASTPPWHIDSCTSFFLSNTLGCSAHIHFSSHAWSNVHRDSQSYIRLLLAVFFACVIFPYISGLEAGGVITSDTVHSGEALRFCWCVTARLDDDQGRILANLRDLTQRLFGVLCFSLVFSVWVWKRKQGRSGWVWARMQRIKKKARLHDLYNTERSASANKTPFSCAELFSQASPCAFMA